MIALTFRLARSWSFDCRGHLGRNATILPVIKLLIRLRHADFGSSFKEPPPPSRLPFLHAASASLSHPWRLEAKVINLCWSYDSEIEVSCDPALSHFTHLLGLNKENHHWMVKQQYYSASLFTLALAGNRDPVPARGIIWRIGEMTC